MRDCALSHLAVSLVHKAVGETLQPRHSTYVPMKVGILGETLCARTTEETSCLFLYYRLQNTLYLT